MSNRGGSGSRGGRGGRGGYQQSYDNKQQSDYQGSSYGGSGSRGGRGGRGGYDRPPSQRGGYQQHDAYQAAPKNDALKNVKISVLDAESLQECKNVQPIGSIVAGTPGKAGKSQKFMVNFSPVKLPEGPFTQYSVKFSPEVESMRLASILLRQHEKLFEKNPYVFDGNAMLFTMKPISNEIVSKQLELVSEYKSVVYKIVIAFASNFSSSVVNEQLLQMFNLIYRRAFKNLGLQQIGRHNYHMAQAVELPQHKVKIVPGIISTLSTSARGVLLNVDIVYRTLRTDIVWHLMQQYKAKYEDYKQRIENELIYSIVLCSYNNKTVFVEGIEWDKTPAEKFVAGGRKISLADYYKEHHNIIIKDMKQPLLVRTKRKNDEKIVEWFIPELCQLTGISEDMRRDHKVMRQIKDHIGLDPSQRSKTIAKFIDEVVKNADMSKALAEWGVKVDPRFLSIGGRVLDPEVVCFKTKEMPVVDAGWQIRDEALKESVAIDDWLVVVPYGMEDDVANFVKVLRQCGAPLGVTFGRFKNATPVNDSIAEYTKAIKRELTASTKFVLVCLPNDGKPLYDAVKQLLCNGDIAVPSQCVTPKTFGNLKGIHSKATKVIVQMVPKLGRTPWTMKFKFPGPTMICGVDVYHSGEVKTRTKNSIVGFTASMNTNVSNFFTAVTVQKPGQEVIDGINLSMQDAIKKFVKSNNIPPAYIVMYRDGVGESQHQEVFNKEVKAIQHLLKELKMENTKLVYILVLKRIHERLFAGTPDAPSNPAPGTIVDTTITAPNGLEWLMTPHLVNQGTATPTKFQCILNEAKLQSDYLQNLSFKLCHCYYNWFGAIRVPSPCMYAHKVAFMVGQHLNKQHSAKLADSLYYL